MTKRKSIYKIQVLTCELADILGRSPQWIRQLTRQGVLKQTDRGKYSLGESVQAYMQHGDARSRSVTMTQPSEKTTEEERSVLENE